MTGHRTELFGTGGYTTVTSTNSGFTTNPVTVSAGLWERNRSDGSHFKLSGGVKAAGVLGVNLSVDTNYTQLRGRSRIGSPPRARSSATPTCQRWPLASELVDDLRLRLADLGLLALVGVSLVAIAGWDLLNWPHPDGSGPLGSLGVPVHDGMRVDPTSDDESWTFGVPLCLASGTTPARLEDVRPVTVDGAGFRYLGSRVRSFTWTAADGPIISVGGWPPPTDTIPGSNERRQRVRGLDPRQGLAEGPQYTELLLGFERVGSDGGGWEGSTSTIQSTERRGRSRSTTT